MTKFPLRMLMRFPEWFEVHLIRWRPAHVELEDETDEELKSILEPPCTLRIKFWPPKQRWRANASK